MKIFSILLVFVGSSVSVNGAWQQCSTMGTPGSWTLPPGSTVQIPSLPQTFQTKVEATIIDQGYTVSAKEYYDGPNNRASMEIVQNGDIQLIINDYANDQMLYVDKNGGCIASNLTTDNNNLVFGDVTQNGKPHAYSTGGVLEFAKKYGELYIGNATIRGIPCDHWRSCMSWPKEKSNFTLDYYFAKPNWNTSFSMVTTPVRAEVVGHMAAGVAGPGHDFHHIYEYIDFRTEIDEDPTTVFEVPKGTLCLGRVSPRAVPMLKGQYYYREEIVSPGYQVINMVDVYYDYSYKLVRYDYRPTAPAYPYYSTDPVTEIHDYNMGIAYAIDKMVGNCTIMPIENSTFDTSIHIDKGTADKGFVLQMKNANQLFLLDNTYVYNGQRRARGIMCDIFAAIRTDFTVPGRGKVVALFEYYFLPANWNERADLGVTGSKVKDVPVMLEITGIGNDFHAIYNIFDFDEDHPALSSFDIGACFTSSQRINFEVIFPIDSIPTMSKYHRVMALEGLVKIAQLTNLSPLRIQHVRVRYDEDGIYLLGSLFESPPTLTQYRKIPGKVLQYRNDATLTNITSDNDCAIYCNLESKFMCNSFDVCVKDGVCSLSKSHTEDGTLITKDQCSHYSRTLQSKVPTVSMNDAWNSMRDYVVKGLFILKVTLDGGKVMVYKATDITTTVYRENAVGTTSAKVVAQFTLFPTRGLKQNKMNQFPGSSIDDCASMCLQEAAYECHSFEFCYQTGTCSLSAIQPDERPDLVVNSQYCDLYSRNYTGRFSELPGTTLLSQSNYIYQKIVTANECAKLCTDFSNFDCKSFDYCPDIKACFINRQHMYDLPLGGLTSQPFCNHYSRRYISDFSYTKGKIIKLQDNRIILDVNKDQCAKLCVQEEGFSCASFDYCGNYTECRLSTASMKSIGQVTIQSSLYCDHYDRNSFADGTPYTPNWQSRYTSSSSTGYTPGAMAGLGFGMLIFGLLIGLAGIFAFSRFKMRTDDGMSIAFTKKEVTADSES